MKRGTAIMEIGTVSSRGQVAIPSMIRQRMGLLEGEKIVFFTEDDTLLIRKANMESFRAITAPLKEAARKAGFRESEVPGIIARFRKVEGTENGNR